MNKFYPFYFHFYSKKTTRDFGLRSFFCPNFVFVK